MQGSWWPSHRGALGFVKRADQLDLVRMASRIGGPLSSSVAALLLNVAEGVVLLCDVVGLASLVGSAVVLLVVEGGIAAGGASSLWNPAFVACDTVSSPLLRASWATSPRVGWP